MMIIKAFGVLILGLLLLVSTIYLAKMNKDRATTTADLEGSQIYVVMVIVFVLSVILSLVGLITLLVFLFK